MSVDAKPLILNVGSGWDRREGSVNIDLHDERADIKADVLDLHMFQDGEADVVIASQILEHFSRHDGERALKEWFRVLRSGGECVVSVPDIEAVCSTFNEIPGEHRQGFMYMLFGWQNEDKPGMIHQWGFTPRGLAKAMEDAGFEVIWMDKNKPPRPTPSVRCVGRKP